MRIFINLIIVSTLATSTSVLAEMKIPYIATSDKTELIKSNYKEINIGNTEKDVISKLNEPDEILDLFEPKKYKPNIIGKTYWYIIQRMSDTGSVNDKNEIVVRISFNLKGEVTRVDKWGF